MAEVIDVSNGTNAVTNTLTLMPNSVAWASGDTVDLPLYPWITQQNGNNYLQKYFAGGQSYGRQYAFGPYWANTVGGGGASFMQVNNQTAASYYTPANNRYTPYGMNFNGAWDDAIRMTSAPTNAAIWVSGCAATGTCGQMTFLESSTTNGSDSLGYNQLNGNWILSAGFGGIWDIQPGLLNFRNAVAIGTTSGHVTTLNGTQINIASGQIVSPSGVDMLIQPNSGQQLTINVPSRNMMISAGFDEFISAGTAIELTAPTVQLIGKTQLGTAQQTTFDANGVKHEGGTAPTASAGTITGTNAAGFVSGLSAATSVTITFANGGWNTWASCTASPSVSLSAAPYVSAISKSAVTFTFPSLTGTLLQLRRELSCC